jgi:retron-type reverse transcriptase
MKMHKKIYKFQCPFNDKIICGKFSPKILKRKIMPLPCKRCKYRLLGNQTFLRDF